MPEPEPEVMRDMKKRLLEAMGDGHPESVDVEDHAYRISAKVLEARISHITNRIEHHRRWDSQT